MAETVQCQICGGRFIFITPTHLKRHGLTMEEYRKRFPQAPLMSAEMREKRAERLRGYSEKRRKKCRKKVRKNVWQNRERQIKAIREGRRKRVTYKKCVDCGKEFLATEPWLQVRCPRCQKQRLKFLDRLRSRRHRKLLEKDFDALKGEYASLKHTYPSIRLGTVGTQAMNLAILPNGRVAGAVWLETGEKQSFKGGDTPKTPWRRHLPKAGWQRRIMKRCPICGGYGIEVYQENPHCLECNGEIILAVENEYYGVNEMVCSRCGLVDNSRHYIFKCKSCGCEHRIAE